MTFKTKTCGVILVFLATTATAKTVGWHKGPRVGVHQLKQNGENGSFAPDLNRTFYTLGADGLYQGLSGYTDYDVSLHATKGFYNASKGFWDAVVKTSFEHEFKFQTLSGEASLTEGDDAFGLIRLPLEEQFSYQLFNDRQQQHYRIAEGQIFHRWDLAPQWYYDLALQIKSVDRVQFTKSVSAYPRLIRVLNPTLEAGIGVKTFAQRTDTIYDDYITPQVFLEYEYQPEAKLGVLYGMGQARSGGEPQRTRSYNISIQHPLQKTEVKAEYDKSQTAYAGGLGISEEDATTVSLLHHVDRFNTITLKSRSSKEESLAEVKEYRSQTNLEAVYVHHWGKEILGEKARFEQEAGLRYVEETFKIRGGGNANRSIFSLYWNRFM